MNATDHIIEAGLKPTKARVAVLDAILNADSALSHTDVLEQLYKQCEFDRVTVYRVLDWLQENNLVHKISGESRARKYQLSLGKQAHKHAHFNCVKCEKIICIHALEPTFPKNVLSEYQVDSIDIHIKGVCPSCKVLG